MHKVSLVEYYVIQYRMFFKVNENIYSYVSTIDIACNFVYQSCLENE